MKQPLGPLCIITDRHRAEGAVIEGVAAVLAAVPIGSAVVQLREKDLGAGELCALARRLLGVTREYRAPLLINDRLDVALAVGADGVHLPENGLELAAARRLAGPEFLLGVSTHSIEGVARAAKSGADLILFGPVYDSPDKRRFGAPQGIVALEKATIAAGTTPLYAVGGFNDETAVRAARAAGAHGVAAIRAFIGPGAPARAALFAGLF